ncbi:mitochondrial carrier domain-containing protein [Pelagophyceae sp. CCMP2097]|nr:mitochondrial carrier domain-containing protein [Pelagophyceae sp. CCMP2097]|mmetsp:Transcript_12299/g.43569  ORF Transcript_12299/g.43569 Transcript_12299/m.43569 type:complete len:290 (-) Transcript_12299:101-970(-)
MPVDGTSTSGASVLAFCAGSFSGAVGVAFGHPLDTLKVRIQLGMRSSLPFSSLYRGVGVPLLTTGGFNALNLGVYQNSVRRWRRDAGLGEDEKTPLRLVACAGGYAGAVCAFFSTPVQRLKILQQAGSYRQPAKLVETLRAFRHRPWLLYLGLPTMLVMESLRAVYMATYVAATRAFDPSAVGVGKSGQDLVRFEAGVLGGVVAGVVSWCIIYPLDSVKSALQAQPPHLPRRWNNTWEVARDLYKEGGLRRFYRGLFLTLLRAGPISGVLLPVYDYSLRALEAQFPEFA